MTAVIQVRPAAPQAARICRKGVNKRRGPNVYERSKEPRALNEPQALACAAPERAASLRL
jgi:hypothetical protein